MRDFDHAAVVQLLLEFAVGERVEHPSHLLLGVVLHVAHVGVHHVQPEVIHHALQLAHAFFVGGDLGLEVVEVLGDVAHGVIAAGEQVDHGVFAEAAGLHQMEVVDQHAFLFDAPGVRRHGAGGDAADIGVVRAAGDVEQDGAAVAIEHRGNHGDIRQVGAAVVGIVEHEHVAGAHGARAALGDGAHALAHGAQVHGHVRRVGHQVAVRVEHGTGEIQAFLDVAEKAVLRRVTPICSATDMNRLLNTSSITGSAWVPTATRRGRACTRSITM